MIPFRPHGTVLRYYDGCRCDLCREAKRVRVAANRAKVRAALRQRNARLGLGL